MANNLEVGPNAVVALDEADDVSFIDAGFNTTNCAIIYEVGNPNKSYVPGRSINPITSFVGSKGYYIVMKQVADKTAYLIPPIPADGGGGGSYGAEATAYFTRVATAGGTLTPTEKEAYDAFVTAAKTHSYYSKLLDLKIRWGGAGAAKLNAIGNTFLDIWANITYARFAAAGNGTSGFSKAGFIPATHFTANNYSFGGYYSGNSNIDGAKIEVGAKEADASTKLMYLLPNQGTVAYVQANSTATTPSLTGITESRGFWGVTRTANNVLKVFKNGAQLGATVTVTESSPLPAVEMYDWAMNDNGSVNGPSNRPHAVDFKALGLTDQNMTDFYADITAFLTAAG